MRARALCLCARGCMAFGNEEKTSRGRGIRELIRNFVHRLLKPSEFHLAVTFGAAGAALAGHIRYINAIDRYAAEPCNAPAATRSDCGHSTLYLNPAFA